MGNGVKERPALINGSKERLRFRSQKMKGKKCFEYRASVDLSNMKESIERIWRLVGTFKGGL